MIARAARFAALCSLIAALCALIYVAGRTGLADLHAESALHDLVTWTADDGINVDRARRRKILSLAEWTTALAAIRSARSFDPDNPVLIETAARIYDWAAMGRPSNNPAVVTLRREALDLFRSAAARRPTSPNTWSNIALVKSKLHSVDAEYLTALANAAFLGPWEPLVQLALAEATMPVWAELPSDARATALQNMRRAFVYRTPELVYMAQLYKRVDLLCGLSDGKTTPVISGCRP